MSSQEDDGGSGMSNICDIVWDHNGDRKACPIYGNCSSLEIDIFNNYKITGYNKLKWETFDISKKSVCANRASYVVYIKRCYDKAGNVSGTMFAHVWRKI